MNFFQITDRKSGVKDRGSGVRGQGSVVNCEAGFTVTELVVVIAIMGILSAMAFSQLRTPNERIACKEIYSNLQLAKMQAVSTGANVTVNVDTDLNAVENVDVPGEVNYLTVQPATLPWGGWPANGVDFDSTVAGSQNTVTFTPKGMVTTVGNGVFLYDVSNSFRVCAVSVLGTGLIRMSTSPNGGATWN